MGVGRPWFWERDSMR
nr:unnamed protein product [Callosobruchus chinensis]